METLIAPAINLAILIVMLAYFVRKPLQDFVKGRHTSIKEELKTVKEQLQQAQARNDELSSKLKAMDAEIEVLQSQLTQEVGAIKNRLLTEAQRHSAQIITDARSSADGLYEELRAKIYAEIGLKVIERSELLLKQRITQEDRDRIKKEFVKQVESSQ